MARIYVIASSPRRSDNKICIYMTTQLGTLCSFGFSASQRHTMQNGVYKTGDLKLSKGGRR